jgi:F-type H+-transporting ATPase subunit delta
LEDPNSKALARVYAIAYLDAARSAGMEEPLEELTSFQDDVLARFPELHNLLTTQLLSSDQKQDLLARTVQPVSSPTFANFLRVLAEHDRLSLFSQVVHEAWLEFERRAGKKRIHVRSAIPLSDEQLHNIKQRIQSTLNLEPLLIPSVEPDLIGGLVIQVGDTVYDGSLKARLNNLHQRLQKGYLYEIQSGRDRFSSPEGN